MNWNRYFDGFTFRDNIYSAMVLRLALAMFLFTICRVGFYLFNTSYFPGLTTTEFVRILYGGLRFDLTAVLYINALNILLTVIPFDLRFSKGYQAMLKYFVLSESSKD